MNAARMVVNRCCSSSCTYKRQQVCRKQVGKLSWNHQVGTMVCTLLCMHTQLSSPNLKVAWDLVLPFCTWNKSITWTLSLSSYQKSEHVMHGTQMISTSASSRSSSAASFRPWSCRVTIFLNRVLLHTRDQSISNCCSSTCARVNG